MITFDLRVQHDEEDTLIPLIQESGLQEGAWTCFQTVLPPGTTQALFFLQVSDRQAGLDCYVEAGIDDFAICPIN